MEAPLVQRRSGLVTRPQPEAKSAPSLVAMISSGKSITQIAAALQLTVEAAQARINADPDLKSLWDTLEAQLADAPTPPATSPAPTAPSIDEPQVGKPSEPPPPSAPAPARAAQPEEQPSPTGQAAGSTPASGATAQRAGGVRRRAATPADIPLQPAQVQAPTAMVTTGIVTVTYVPPESSGDDLSRYYAIGKLYELAKRAGSSIDEIVLLVKQGKF